MPGIETGQTREYSTQATLGKKLILNSFNFRFDFGLKNVVIVYTANIKYQWEILTDI